MIYIKKIRLFSLLLFPIALFINFIGSKFPNLVDKYYSTYINKVTISILSKVTEIFPFSLYEVCMYLIVFSTIIFLIYIIKTILTDKKSFKKLIVNSSLNILSILSILYFLFILLWGLNYNRTPLQTVLLSNYNSSYNKNISLPRHNTEDLKKLYQFLISKSNETRNLVSEDSNGVMKSNTDYKGIISRAQTGYNNISTILPQVKGDYAKPKYVLSSNLMCYTGILGIYFPFTGEANVNVAVPDVYISSTVLHEMAHQRGFGSEDEANFIGYLASINHPDIDFQYSGYILALKHTARALASVDYDSYLNLSENISSQVSHDLKYNSEFWKKYEGKIEEVSDKFNDSYLKSNGVKEGTASYGKIVDLLLTYYSLYSY
ncbi:DUF3810 domain-containing protein [Romboutsia sp.]|uniref:DUF3810 domain-containing protein n=1 Tax=Romboutsia sp. TaxID=1965302 RepID=UPI003F3B815D